MNGFFKNWKLWLIITNDLRGQKSLAKSCKWIQQWINKILKRILEISGNIKKMWII